MDLEERLSRALDRAHRSLFERSFIISTTRLFGNRTHPTPELSSLYDDLAESFARGYVLDEVRNVALGDVAEKDAIIAYEVARGAVERIKPHATCVLGPRSEEVVLGSEVVDGLLQRFVKKYDSLVEKGVIRTQQHLINFSAEYFHGVMTSLEGRIPQYELKVEFRDQTIAVGHVSLDDPAVYLSPFTFDDVIGLEDQKEVARRKIIKPITHPKKWLKLKRLPSKTIDQMNFLLYGPPGTGKSHFALCLAGEVKVPFYQVTGSDFVQSLLGQGKNMLSELYAKASRHDRAIIFIDEADCLAMKRGIRSTELTHDVLTEFLTILDGARTRGSVATIMSSNMDVMSFDGALFDRIPPSNHLYFGPLDLDAKERIFFYQLGLFYHAPVDDTAKLRELLGPLNPRKIKQLVHDAATRALYHDRGAIAVDDVYQAAMALQSTFH